MATLKLDNVQFIGSAADVKIAAHNDSASAHGIVAWKPVSNCIAGAVQRAPLTNYTAMTVRTRHISLTATRSIRLAFLGTYQVGSAETLIANPVEIKASIETPDGVSLPLFFGGRRLTLLRPGQVLLSDPVTVYLSAGSVFYARVFQNRLSSSAYTSSGETGLLAADQGNMYYGYYSRGIGDINNDGEQYAISASTGINPYTVDVVDATGTAGLSNTGSVKSIRPVVIGSRDGSSVGILGTSIDFGSGESYVGYVAGAGYLSRACNSLGVPSINLAIMGSSYRVGWLPSGKMSPRGELLAYVDTVIIGGPTNDLILGDTVGTVIGNVTRMSDRMKAAGKKVVLITAFPRSSSTDNWTTVENQTALEADARSAYNSWLISTPPASCDLVIDAAAAVRDSSGVWSSGTMLATGTAVATNTSYLEDTGASFIANEFAGYVVRNVTTGTSAVCLYNTTTRVYVSGGGFTIGDTYQIWRQPTYDGTHPSGYGHSLAATVVQNELHAFL